MTQGICSKCGNFEILDEEFMCSSCSKYVRQMELEDEVLVVGEPRSTLALGTGDPELEKKLAETLPPARDKNTKGGWAKSKSTYRSALDDRNYQ